MYLRYVLQSLIFLHSDVQAEPTAELLKERYVHPAAQIISEQVCCSGG